MPKLQTLFLPLVQLRHAVALCSTAALQLGVLPALSILGAAAWVGHRRGARHCLARGSVSSTLEVKEQGKGIMDAGQEETSLEAWGQSRNRARLQKLEA